MRSFDQIYTTAVLHKGSEQAVLDLLPRCLSNAELLSVSDNELLSSMMLRVFQAGLKHDMVAAKWPAFRVAFADFNPAFCTRLSDEVIETAMTNQALIRHLGKLKAIRANAQMVHEIALDYGSFAQFIADWPVEDIVGLWRELKKRGSQLGGMSAPYFLRIVGKDTFLLTKDVVAVLIAEGILDKSPTAQADLLKAQAAFNLWREESGLPACQISRIVAMNTM